VRGPLLSDQPVPASCPRKDKFITEQCKPPPLESQTFCARSVAGRGRSLCHPNLTPLFPNGNVSAPYDRLPNASAALIPPNPKELDTARRTGTQAPSPVT
jgi:hypothetical protein